jgi:amino-acid N-acetyltransferase
MEQAALAARKASMRDVADLLRLINGYASQGIMLPRTEFEISENLRDFTVVCSENRVVGCGALHFYTSSMGEIRSLAVEEQWKQRGTGKQLVEALEAEARAYDLEAVFAFTYIPAFFQKLGFVEIERGALPLKAWKDCLRCPKFQCCDEIAVIKSLGTGDSQAGSPRLGGVRARAGFNGDNGVVLPIVKRSP